MEELIFQFCRDITTLERKGRYDPISGREREIDEVTLILLQKGRKNVVLLAPAGVGKTALVVGLAQRIVKGDVPEYLKNARVIEVDLSSMAAGTNGPADFQSRFIPLCRGMAERYHDPDYPKYIMFIDEIHMIMPTCEGSGYRGLSEVMKPYLTVGDLHVIGATTDDEYRIYVKEDPALDRRFQQVPLTVPTPEETFHILQMLRPGLEKHHHLKIPDECLQLVIKLTEEHLPRRNQPDKSIVMLDGACAWHIMKHGWDNDLTPESVKKMVSIECKIHPDAL
ncbi:MAG: ATP-dependent Clp protease ATP-binding subunit [Rhodospirillales bacterium]|nr:ATP-dependent Clp protease ATP-binding subunit [Rhodospirillales bacterium]MCB9997083.1 ATP-dependent Clp protease ATP-binding subunit [Rhodospirillales bacterium]